LALLFEWDEGKARSNEAKHGISFDEASTLFSDPFSLTIADPLHSFEEDRFVTIGWSVRARLVVAIHADREDALRIISARLATSRERQVYERQR
jgi:uncharacterized DUF497 family protein